MEEAENISNGQRAADAPESRGATFGQRVGRMSDGVGEAVRGTRESIEDIRQRIDIEGRVRRNPYGMVAAALGAGYVLGGGLFSPLTARIVGLGLRLGIRMAAIPFLRDEIESIIDTMGADDAGDAAAGGAEGDRPARRATRSRSKNQGR